MLDQAADLLRYQVDRRLQGAARAQVATRLAIVYLMNHKPEQALATLRGTHAADVANEFHNQRLLIEARALPELGRHDVALEVIDHIDGRAAIRLRADILWAARRWAPAAEQIELYYGERANDFEPLKGVERADILRAATGFALARTPSAWRGCMKSTRPRWHRRRTSAPLKSYRRRSAPRNSVTSHALPSR